MSIACPFSSLILVLVSFFCHENYYRRAQLLFLLSSMSLLVALGTTAVAAVTLRPVLFEASYVVFVELNPCVDDDVYHLAILQYMVLVLIREGLGRLHWLSTHKTHFLKN